MKDFFKPTKTKRLFFFLITDTLIFVLSLYLSFFLRFDFDLSQVGNYWHTIYYWLPVFVLLKIVLFAKNRLYSISWRFVSIEEFFKINISLITSFLLISFFNYLVYIKLKRFTIPRSVPFVDFFISLFLISFFRISKRLYKEKILKNNDLLKKGKALIIGAGITGERIVRELLQSKRSDYYPVGFLDDNPLKQDTYIHNIKVLGPIALLDKILKEENIDVIIIAIPTLPHKKIKEIYNIAQKNNVNDIKIVPSISNLPQNLITFKDLRDIKLEDLLAREPVSIDTKLISNLVNNKTILVTGGAGSIGSEIVRQLIKYKPKRILVFEIDETEIHNLSLELEMLMKRLGLEVEMDYIVGDIKDYKKLNFVFKDSNIDVVFHAAAYKHVPLMEFFPEEAVKTNVFGTYNLAKLSCDFGVKKFVNISTDKAVNPTSIMGATKRLGEMICNGFQSLRKTKFISVRFGNVLGSRGSVIPIFLEQIKNQGRVTVTHPEVKRYFMTIPEAVLLVFQAASMGEGGEVFVLDMGEPVKIVRLAEELIKLNGLTPYQDVEIVFTGLRPGEKLFEELLTAEEGVISSRHSKIFIAKTTYGKSLQEIEEYLKAFKKIIDSGEYPRIKKKLQEIIEPVT
ncbi:nucleoside-diphosphate sugar epimerase/dehydratase [Desulfothermus naphthae]